MTQHTPGPWIIDPAKDLPLAVIENTELGFGICEIDPQNREGEAQANARLIAASPDLLKAGEEFLEAMAGTDSLRQTEAAIALASAIAKAKGE